MLVHNYVSKYNYNMQSCTYIHLYMHLYTHDLHKRVNSTNISKQVHTHART